jgi:2-polyprenyl-6-hydroxyphenyl methylase/3-demethylubiquinone-9 3-methyltransferase
MNTVTPNADPAELSRFASHAARWWDANGEARPLHDLNPVRAAWIAARVPLAGARIADVGCGGGLLSEALAARGAQVIGVDLSPELIEVARLHLFESGLSVDYRVCGGEDLARDQPGQLDAVCCLELLEHVPAPAALVQALADLLKPGGRLVLSTLNRSPQAFAGAIIGAEYLLHLLPRGTHHYARFIRPSELAGMLRAAGLELLELAGLGYAPFLRRAWVSPRVDVNYIVLARKPE